MLCRTTTSTGDAPDEESSGEGSEENWVTEDGQTFEMRMSTREEGAAPAVMAASDV